MLWNVDRRRFLQGAAATGLVMTQGIRTASAAEPLKVGFIYVGPVGDYGWSHGHDVGRKRSEEHTSELQSLMRISYAVFCLKKKKKEHTSIKYIQYTKISTHIQ